MTEAENERDCRYTDADERHIRRWALERAQVMVGDNVHTADKLLYLADRFTAFVMERKVTDDEDAG